MFKFLALCALCVCATTHVAKADDCRGRLLVSASFPGFFALEYQVEPAERTEVLPPGLEPCGYMVKEGVVFEIFARECGELLGERWAHDISDKDPYYYPFRFIQPDDSVLPPEDSAEDVGSTGEILAPDTEASIRFDPLLDEVEILVQLNGDVAGNHLVPPSKRARVRVNVLGGGGMTNGFMNGNFDEVIPGGSIAMIRGSTQDVVEYLVQDMHLVSGTFTTVNSGTTYRLVGDLDSADRWHVLMNDSWVLRSFSITSKGGKP